MLLLVFKRWHQEALIEKEFNLIRTTRSATLSSTSMEDDGGSSVVLGEAGVDFKFAQIEVRGRLLGTDFSGFFSRSVRARARSLSFSLSLSGLPPPQVWWRNVGGGTAVVEQARATTLHRRHRFHFSLLTFGFHCTTTSVMDLKKGIALL
jgi:hypothetical protein